jgi:acetate kinase
MQILVVNSGSSSIKFSIFAVDANASDADPQCLMTGQLKNVGTGQGALEFRLGDESSPMVRSAVDAPTLTHATAIVIDTITASNMPSFEAAGYRVVHPGPNLRDHVRITADVLHELEEYTAFAPLHNPETVKLIKTFIARFPKIPHYVCFDTIFHETMPEAATTYPLPQQYINEGIRRYGAHGLSCESIVVHLRAKGDVPRRMVIAHLGSGCSVTALIDGESVDTSMGMTPTGGVVMGTRPVSTA